MLNYTLDGKKYIPVVQEEEIISNNPTTTSEDWNNTLFSNYKTNLKFHIILHQNDRCAYCRKLLEADGKYEPLEHIVAKTIRPEWQLLPMNLIVTCDSCNNLKGSQQVLQEDYVDVEDYPLISNAYIIFHPYFDNWSDHLDYENDIFIVPIKNSKGLKTIQICKLYRYNIIINRAKELKLGQKSPMGKIIHRLRGMDISDPQYEILKLQLLDAMEHFNNRTQDLYK